MTTSLPFQFLLHQFQAIVTYGETKNLQPGSCSMTKVKMKYSNHIRGKCMYILAKQCPAI